MYELDVINLRIACVYGPRLPQARIPKIFVDAVAAKRGGDSPMDHTYVDDIVAGTLAALEHPSHHFDVYNLGTGSAAAVFDGVAALKALVPTARISVGPGEITHPGGYAMPRKRALNSQRATNVFGYSPRLDLHAGLSAYLAGVTETFRRNATKSKPH
jgi:nucleoside-diphosphate-sugar epimerase